MKKTNGDGPAAGQQPDDLERRKLVVNLGNIFVRLTLAKRRKAMTLLERFTFGNSSSVSYWDSWTKEDSFSLALMDSQHVGGNKSLRRKEVTS
jgi:hypothetical protein